ncbi:MAG: 2-C-methyl-D-erythritol 4-phosphate cytidylyltransferase, partial [Actinobacteria bacterium]|nr:2-C-methyl-D-erythritol 4-phosphate cytidylyltransferase [Actinomycetota bacterium]
SIPRLQETGGRIELIASASSPQVTTRRALELVTSPTVVIDDLTRPFVTPHLVLRVLDALQSADGAIAAVPVDETLKRTHSRQVEETIDRSGLWRVQAPQAFLTEALRAAHERARKGRVALHDNAQLVERYGGSIVVVPGMRANIKVASDEDLLLAEAMARAERRGA